MGRESMGVSVVVCCHNSALRLGDTLQHLARQEVPIELGWEVVVVDNASTDGTREVAEASWPPGAPARMRVVSERRAGLRYARERGLEQSCWPIVSFIDDDNWVAPDWVARVGSIMATRAEVGACGGLNEAVCEVAPPSWFAAFAYCYAVGPQGGPEEPSPGPRSQLWGAGLSIRREPWERLMRDGFKPLLSDRVGGELTAGGDSELCLALRLAGWQLWYDPGLRLKHFIPANRLKWAYLRGLKRGFGATVLDPYWHEVDDRQRALPAWRRSWIVTAFREVRALPRWVPGWWRGLRGGGEGDPRVLDAEHSLGRCGGLLRAAGSFGERARAVREAPWREPDRR